MRVTQFRRKSAALNPVRIIPVWHAGAVKKPYMITNRKKASRARGITAQVNNSLRRATAAFSILLTCAWLTPTFSLISFWVLPSK